MAARALVILLACISGASARRANLDVDDGADSRSPEEIAKEAGRTCAAQVQSILAEHHESALKMALLCSPDSDPVRILADSSMACDAARDWSGPKDEHTQGIFRAEFSQEITKLLCPNGQVVSTCTCTYFHENGYTKKESLPCHQRIPEKQNRPVCTVCEEDLKGKCSVEVIEKEDKPVPPAPTDAGCAKAMAARLSKTLTRKAKHLDREELGEMREKHEKFCVLQVDFENKRAMNSLASEFLPNDMEEEQVCEDLTKAQEDIKKCVQAEWIGDGCDAAKQRLADYLTAAHQDYCGKDKPVPPAPTDAGCAKAMAARYSQTLTRNAKEADKQELREMREVHNNFCALQVDVAVKRNVYLFASAFLSSGMKEEQVCEDLTKAQVDIKKCVEAEWIGDGCDAAKQRLADYLTTAHQEHCGKK